MQTLKKKNPKINFKARRRDSAPTKMVESVLHYPRMKKLALYRHLQPAADASFQEISEGVQYDRRANGIK